MAEVRFPVEARIGTVDREREAALRLDGFELVASAPSALGGKGAGTSPEALVAAGALSCWSLTFEAVLKRRELPFASIDSFADAVVSGVPGSDRYSAVRFSARVQGGDASRLADYEAAARRALERSFIVHALSGGTINFELASVTIP
ncbi:MAG: OsmC family protein [Spirochaetales bacterium]|nr:OsmC family protein [Spirochaetales bacterium]